MTNVLTRDEQIFVERMAAHVMLGKSFDEAARAVIEDDKRIARWIKPEYRPGGWGPKTYGYWAQGVRDGVTRQIYLGCRAGL